MSYMLYSTPTKFVIFYKRGLAPNRLQYHGSIRSHSSLNVLLKGCRDWDPKDEYPRLLPDDFMDLKAVCSGYDLEQFMWKCEETFPEEFI